MVLVLELGSSLCFLTCFLCFILLFWNQVFTCVSVRLKALANSTLSGVDRYLCTENLFSKPEKIFHIEADEI